MPYEFRCADAGAEPCHGTVRAETEQELVEKVSDHMRKKHNIQQVSKTLQNFIRKTAKQR